MGWCGGPGFYAGWWVDCCPGFVWGGAGIGRYVGLLPQSGGSDWWCRILCGGRWGGDGDIPQSCGGDGVCGVGWCWVPRISSGDRYVGLLPQSWGSDGVCGVGWCWVPRISSGDRYVGLLPQSWGGDGVCGVGWCWVPRILCGERWVGLLPQSWGGEVRVPRIGSDCYRSRGGAREFVGWGGAGGAGIYAGVGGSDCYRSPGGVREFVGWGGAR